MTLSLHQRIIDVLIGIVEIPVHLLLSLAVPVVCLFARWDDWRTTWSGGADYPDYPTHRGDLPRWAYIWSTPDERLPGDVRMPQTRKVLDYWTGLLGERAGRYVCSVWWLLRNRLYGLSWLMGRPALRYIGLNEDAPENRLWRRSYDLGPVQIRIGWKVHRADEHADASIGPFWAIRAVHIKRIR